MSEMPERPATTLEHVDESWERALVIVAHPDDMEYGGAAAVARWTKQGKHVAYALVTSGEAGIDGLPPDEARPLREAEQRASCAVVGVTDVEFLGFPDGTVEYGLPLRRAVAAAVRRHRPDVVITANFRETYGGIALNQADHIAVGRAVLDGARDAGNRWVFADLLDEGLAPWNKVRQIWAVASPEGKHGADVGETFELGVASLRAHKAYLAGLGEGAGDPADFLEGFARQVGTGLGCTLGVGFEVFPLQLF
ncbi:MAG: LmbE family N-acetylglucosaminyl deacetylase [Frankiales bacterium]|nr:LmbE family N-acetylglucosaminyl deacetylase [Frankiales bacterium]